MTSARYELNADHRTRLLSTAELADIAGVTPRMVRFYESRGLLKPQRAGTFRVFSYIDRARLSLILRGKRLGFSLREIGEYLNLYGASPGHASPLNYVVDKSRERLAELAGKLKNLQAAIRDLRKIEHDALKHLRSHRLKTARTTRTPILPSRESQGV